MFIFAGSADVRIVGRRQYGIDVRGRLGLERFEFWSRQAFAASDRGRVRTGNDLGLAIRRGTRSIGDAAGDQRAFGDVAGGDELGRAGRIELGRQLAGSVSTITGMALRAATRSGLAAWAIICEPGK
jgi:hypothetical protein